MHTQCPPLESKIFPNAHSVHSSAQQCTGKKEEKDLTLIFLFCFFLKSAVHWVCIGENLIFEGWALGGHWGHLWCILESDSYQAAKNALFREPKASIGCALVGNGFTPAKWLRFACFAKEKQVQKAKNQHLTGRFPDSKRKETTLDFPAFLRAKGGEHGAKRRRRQSFLSSEWYKITLFFEPFSQTTFC